MIPAVVVVGAILIIFTVQLIVLLVKTEQIPQRKAIMAGDEIEAFVRVRILRVIDVGTTNQTGSKR